MKALIPYNNEQYLIKLPSNSDFTELYQLTTYPKQMLVRKDGIIYHFGQRLEGPVLDSHLEYLDNLGSQVCDEIKDFRIVKSNVDSSQRTQLMSFIKMIEISFENALAKTISWRVDFDEFTNYTVKGDAQRSFAFKISLITSSEHDRSLELVELF
jgi:hypothetical protein